MKRNRFTTFSFSARTLDIRARRLLITPLIALVVLVVLALRVIDLQVIQSGNLKEIAENNRFFHKVVVADRGILYDRFGKPLVFNKPEYYQLTTPNRLFSERHLLSESDALEEMATAPASIFSEQYREYVYPEALSQVTGYVGPVTREDLDRNPNYSIHQSIGKVGLEAMFDSALTGQDGEITYETNAKGEILRTASQKLAVVGKHLQTSLDSELSEYVFSLLKGGKGAVLVGDPYTGEVLSLVSSPTFNANQFTRPTVNDEDEKQKKIQLSSYFQNPDKLFFNRAMAGGYPPGSVFKPVTALGALENDAIDEDTKVDDTGILKVGEFEYGNWYFRQYGRVEGNIGLVKAIARSNDIFFYKTAEWLGPEKLSDTAKLLGFGKKTGLELPAETSGIVPNPAWKEKAVGERWYLGDTYHFGIGQGDLLVTPAQVFQSITLFANKGKLCAPTLLRDKKGNCQDISVTQEHIDLIRSGMEQACSRGGTGFPFFSWNETTESKVLCKTGTAEFGAQDGRGHRKTHAWFVGFTTLETHQHPVQKVKDGILQKEVIQEQYPKNILVTVLVESGDDKEFKEGSADGGPIALSIMKWIKENR